MIKKLIKSIKKILFPHWTDYWSEMINSNNDKKILNVGPGLNKIEKTISIDISKSVNPDIVWDLNKNPWPIETSSIDTIIALNVIEHLDDTVKTIEELHRISKPNGTIYILCPHFSSASAFLDPTHKKFFSNRTFDYFIKDKEFHKDFGFYRDFRFSLEKTLILVMPLFRYIPFILLIINKFPSLWEDYFAFIIRGEGIFYKLKVLK